MSLLTIQYPVGGQTSCLRALSFTESIPYLILCHEPSTVSAVIVPMHRNGTNIPAVKFNLGSGASEVVDMTLDSNRNIYITGVFNDDIFVLKYNQNFTVAWYRVLQSAQYDLSTSIFMANSDALVGVTGITYGNLGTTNVNQGNGDAFCLTYSANNGTFRWATLAGGTRNDRAGIGIDFPGVGAAFAGYLQTQRYTQTAFVQVVRYSDGSLLWSNGLSTTFSEYQALLAKNDTLYVYGKVQGNVNGIDTGGDTQIYIGRYSSTGVMDTAYNIIYGSNAEVEVVYGGVYDSRHDLWICTGEWFRTAFNYYAFSTLSGQNRTLYSTLQVIGPTKVDIGLQRELMFLSCNPNCILHLDNTTLPSFDAPLPVLSTSTSTILVTSTYALPTTTSSLTSTTTTSLPSSLTTSTLTASTLGSSSTTAMTSLGTLSTTDTSTTTTSMVGVNTASSTETLSNVDQQVSSQSLIGTTADVFTSATSTATQSQYVPTTDLTVVTTLPVTSTSQLPAADPIVSTTTSATIVFDIETLISSAKAMDATTEITLIPALTSYYLTSNARLSATLSSTVQSPVGMSSMTSATTKSMSQIGTLSSSRSGQAAAASSIQFVVGTLVGSLLSSQSQGQQVQSTVSSYNGNANGQNVSLVDLPIFVPIVVGVSIVFMSMAVCAFFWIRRLRRNMRKIQTQLKSVLVAPSSYQVYSSYKASQSDTSATMSTYGTTMMNTSMEISIPAHLQAQFGVDYRNMQKLAAGGGGELYLCQLLTSQVQSRNQQQQLAVCKVISEETTQYQQKQQMAPFYQEVSLLYRFNDDPLFAKVIAFSDNPYSMVLSYYPFGSLNDYIYGKSADSMKFWYSKRQIVHLLKQTAVALQKLHAIQVAHCDVKPANILLQTRGDGFLWPVMTDFGISQLLNPEGLQVKAFQVSSLRGISLSYASPESILLYRNLTPSSMILWTASDVYSVSIVMLELLTRSLVWNQNTVLLNRLSQGSQQMPVNFSVQSTQQVVETLQLPETQQAAETQQQMDQ
ncbi:hypothetical protein MP228_009124 [Amoeboaphelidium protococcarum]|nr:hypothetical protein MP228_009124 [Amoeboaphelidium protococcarum]